MGVQQRVWPDNAGDIWSNDTSWAVSQKASPGTEFK